MNGEDREAVDAVRAELETRRVHLGEDLLARVVAAVDAVRAEQRERLLPGEWRSS